MRYMLKKDKNIACAWWRQFIPSAFLILALFINIIPPPLLTTIAPKPFAQAAQELLPQVSTARAQVTSFPYNENFDGGFTFGTGTTDWINISGENSGTANTDWVLHTGATPSTSPIGPNADHTTGSGHYLYVEATGGSIPMTI